MEGRKRTQKAEKAVDSVELNFVIDLELLRDEPWKSSTQIWQGACRFGVATMKYNLSAFNAI